MTAKMTVEENVYFPIDIHVTGISTYMWLISIYFDGK